MPDDAGRSMHITLRLPTDIVEAFDRLATLLERPRSWVMVRAARHYLEAEGAELSEDAQAITELERGDSVPFERVLADMDAIIERNQAKRARKQ